MKDFLVKLMTFNMTDVCCIYIRETELYNVRKRMVSSKKCIILCVMRCNTGTIFKLTHKLESPSFLKCLRTPMHVKKIYTHKQKIKICYC